MSTIKLQPNLTNCKTWEDLRRWADIAIQAIQRTVNGQLEFGFNIRATKVDVVLTGSTPVRVEHGLGRVPIGFIVINLDAGEVVYKAPGDAYAWTESYIYLVSTAAVNATIEVI